MKEDDKLNGGEKQILWLVERNAFGEFLAEVFAQQFKPAITVRRFERPETALEALRHSAEIPAVLMTAFYFDGDYQNGFWLTHEALKIHRDLKTIVTSGYPLDHLRGVAADLKIQPDLLLVKSESLLQDWFPRLQQLLSRPRNGPQETSRPEVPDRVGLLRLVRQRAVRWTMAWTHEKPLVYVVGPSRVLLRLKAYADAATPSRRGSGYDLEHFERPEWARASLLDDSRKPDVLVTDYYLEGAYLNGLKLIRDAQITVPAICTVLANCVSEHHLRGLIEGSGILPDFVFDDRGLL